MAEPQTRTYEFNNFRIDAAKRLLLKDEDEIVPLMPKAFDTLLYLVQNSGKVIEKDALMSAVWSDTIVEENNLTQNISILRRVFGEKPGEHRFIVTVPGKGYKFVPAVREFVGEEMKEAKSLPGKFETVKEQKPKTESQNPRFWLAALTLFGVLALGVIGFYFWRENTKSDDTSIKSVAVLPFKPLVAENRNEALEFGMTDTLISKLSGVEIIVRPLNAVRRYSSLEQDSLLAGRELNAEAVLDGTIQTSGDRIRVSTRLFRTIDGKLLWAGQFDEKLTDIFAVQDSISERVATALKIQLGSRNKKHYTENVEAYQLYMKGRFHSLKLILPEAQKGITYYEQAIKLDPNYALAYAGIADTYRALVLTNEMPGNEIFSRAKAAAQKAVEIDETLPEAQAVLAGIAFFYDWDWQAAEKHCLRGIELDPNNSDIHLVYAHLLSNTGQHEKALAEAKRARESDPLNSRNNALEGQFLIHAGQIDAAIENLRKTIDLDPNFWLSHHFASSAYTEKGMYEQAVIEANKAKEISGSNSLATAYEAYALAKAGKDVEAQAALDELLKLSKERYVPPYSFALIYSGLGKHEKALDYLEQGFAEKDVRMVFLKVEPKFNNLRNERRFNDLMRRMNFE